MMSQLNMIDWILLVILLIYVIFSFIRGALSTKFPFFTIGLALYLSISFKDFFSSFFKQYFANPIILDIIGYVISFLVIVIIAKILKMILKLVIESTGLGVIDHPLGAIFGLIKASLIMLFIISILHLSSFSNSAIYQQSIIIEAINPQINWMIERMPNSISDLFNKYVFDNINNQKAQVFEAIKQNSNDLKQKFNQRGLKKIDKVINKNTQ